MDTSPPRPSNWIDRLPWPILLLVAAWLAVAPVMPQPHLIEKIHMLINGTLSRLIDIFDLVMHTTPLMLVAIKIGRLVKKRSQP